MGPWGGMGGDAHENDITVAPRRLKSITISCDVVVDSLAFTCTDQNGQQHAAGPWGESGSRIEKVCSVTTADTLHFILYIVFTLIKIKLL
jgi:hypothetical protein